MSDLQNQLQEILGTAFRIDRELGGAGMSRVFVATEIELDRQVVVKVLPPDLSAGINVDRFRREIQLAAKLQHPHIVPLLSAGAKGSLLYYMMPFIDGEDLRTRLSRTRDLPVQEATKIVRDVADALSYAHSKGIVHRDIKPENILISGSHALVTDFGVSKALTNATAESPSNGPSLTSLGVALGTPAYMAPEQVAADPLVDARADIYALGIVSYELLTGKTPFAGLNQHQILSAHITTAPASITQHRPQLPSGLAAIVMRSLEKNPSDRWQSASELHAALEPFAVASGATAPIVPIPRKRFEWTPQRIAVAAGILGLVATGLFASTIAFRGRSPTLAVSNTHQVTNFSGLEIYPRLSPDGKLIAYTARGGERPGLHVRQLSGGRPIHLADSAGFPSWTPDGSKILFSRFRARNFTVPSLGGVPTLVPGLDGLFNCTYSNKADRLACVDDNDGALVIAGPTGENRRKITATASGDGVMMPAWSNDDRWIAFSRGNQGFYSGDNIGNLAPSEIWVIQADGDIPVQITDRTSMNMSPAWTPDGSLLYISSRGGSRDIYMQRLSASASPQGEPLRLTTGANIHTISLNRTGELLAYSVFTTDANIWSLPISGSVAEMKQLTSGNQTIESFAVSPDARTLAYDSNVNGNQDIFTMTISGGEPQQITHNNRDNFAPDFSPDGKEIVYHTLEEATRDLYIVDAAGGNPVPIFKSPSEEMGGAFTGDGKSIFYLNLPDSVFTVTRNDRGQWGRPRFLARANAGAAALDNTGFVVFVSAPGMLCDKCKEGIYQTSMDLSSYRFVPTPKMDAALRVPGLMRWSRDSRHAYMAMREKDRTSSIWQLPINGDEEKRVVHWTDPAKQPYRLQFQMDEKNFYVVIGDRQSDIWTMNLEKQ